MSVFNAAEFDQHEEVVFINEPSNGLRAIIAIHSTTLGPAHKSPAQSDHNGGLTKIQAPG